MSAFGGRYDGNGDFAGASPPARTGAFDGFAGGDDRSQSERRSSRSRDRDREREKDRGRNDDRDRHRSEGRGQDRERERDHDRHRSRDRDRERGRSHGRDHDYDLDRERERGHDRHRSRDRDRERGISHGRDRDRGRDDYDRSHTRDYDRHRARDREREGHHGHRSRSRTRGESEHRSKSRSRPGSRSRSKSKRISGFDMAPPQNAPMVSGVVAQGLLPGAPAAIPGFFPNMLNIPVQQLLMPQAMTQQATRHARRVYVGGLSPSANEQSIAAFFSQVMAVIGGNTAGPGDPVVNVYINHDKKFAFVEMRSVEEASNAMALDGIIFEGAPVKVRRPTDYNPSLAAALGPSQPNPNLNLTAVGLKPGSAGGLEGPDRIFVGGLPYYFTEAQVRELLESFGPLRGFDLVKDRETGNSKGYAFCVYQDLSVTDIACAALNGIKMGDKTLTVRRANQGAVQPRPEQEIVLQQAQQQVALQRMMFQPGSAATKVVCLANVVDADELKEEESYEDIMEDMRLEAEKYGKLVNLVIPRPGPNGEAGPGVGKVFLEYGDTDGAMKAKQALHGRKFGGKLVNAVFFAENKFAQGEYEYLL